MDLARRIFLLGAAAAQVDAQPALAPCIASSLADGALRLVFRAPSAPAPRGARVILLLRLRDKPPEQVKLNGKPAEASSRARNWTAVVLPRGTSWQRIAVEPGAAFEGCRDPALSPYLVFEPDPRRKK